MSVIFKPQMFMNLIHRMRIGNINDQVFAEAISDRAEQIIEELDAAAPELLNALLTIQLAFRDGGSQIERIAALMDGEKAIAKSKMSRR